MDGTSGPMTSGNYSQEYARDITPNAQAAMQQCSQPDPNQILRDASRILKGIRKHFSWLGGMYMLGVIVIYAVQLLIPGIAMYIWPDLLQNGDISLLFSMAPMYLIGMPVLILLVKTTPAQKIEPHPMKPGHFVIAAIMCFGAVYLTNIIGIIITTVIGMLKGSSVQNELANVTESVSLWMIALIMVICAPIIEEYVFRKLIVERTIRYGEGVAVLLSGLMFGLFHGNLNQFIYAFVLGMFLAFLYVKTGKLKITIALHMMINFMGGLVTSVLTRFVPLDEYEEIMDRMDMPALMNYVNENMAGLVAYGAFMIFVLVCIIAGLVLFIVFLAKRKFTFAQGQVVIPKGEKFHTVCLNLGMAFYEIFWIGIILYQLLM